jgi:hypothetical protein
VRTVLLTCISVCVLHIDFIDIKWMCLSEPESTDTSVTEGKPQDRENIADDRTSDDLHIKGM